MRNGVEEYWIVDIDARVIERWRSPDRPEIVSEILTWAPDAEPFTLDLPSFFREVLGD